MTNNTVLIKLLDEVNMVLVGLSKEHLDFFVSQYAVFAPNYVFHPLYKLGRWDGRINYFSKTAKTYVYLLSEILPTLAKFHYKIVLEDKRPIPQKLPTLIDNNVFVHVNHLDTGLPIILRDDQVAGVNALLADGNGICLSSTGSGKTLMTAAICEAYGKCGYHTLTIVPNDTLLQQTKADYINCGLDTGEYSGSRKILAPQHIISTWQALKNNPKVVELFNVVVVDECHGAKGAVLQRLLIDHCANVPFRFGVTGTMPKEPASSMAVLCALGPVKHIMKAKTLMDMGILAQLHIDVIQLEENLQDEYQEYCNEITFGTPVSYEKFKEGYFPDYAAEKNYLRHNDLRTGWIAALIESKRNDKKGNVLCLVDNIPFGKTLAALIPNAIFVNGKDMKTTHQKQEVYDLFKHENNLVVIATVHIAGTGLSIRRIFHLVTIDIGKSFIRVIQGIGRSLRIADDKNSVTMADICSDLKYSKEHLSHRVSYFKEAQYDYKLHKFAYNKIKINA